MSSRAHSAARPVAFGAAAALLAALSVVQAAPAARADEVTLRGMDLPVPATDISQSDTDLGSTDREVVVLTDGRDGPEVTKLRARTDAEAAALAAKLDAMPGVTAAPNTQFSLPEQPASGAGRRSHSYATEAAGADRVQTSASTIAAEQYGSEQWGLYWVGAEPAWAITRGAGITVAVIDTGVDRSHPDLAGRTLAQVNLVKDGFAGDPVGHGTHVAGIISARLDGAGVVGLANQATILPIRVLDSAGEGDLYTVAAGVTQAVNRGAQVINMSLGSPGNAPVLAKAVSAAVSRGITVVAAGGNSYAQGNPVEYPAAYPGVIAVSSLGEDGLPSDFANSGSYIDLIAPGEEIISTVPRGYAEGTGTSMAAPFVAASAALVRAANPLLDGSAVVSTLTSTALDDESGDGWDSEGGYGLVQADAAALRAAKAPGGIRSPGKPVAVRVARSGYGNVLAVDVNPNRGSASYAFRVQKRSANGTWTTLPTVYRTEASAETRRIALPKGTYRVFVPASTGYRAAVSPAVTLTSPIVKVVAGRDSAKSKLKVNVDPNKGSGYWTFKVQKRNANGSWSTLKGYKTKGSGETRTVNLKKGTYRVTVATKYGYLGATSAPVTLVK